MAPVIAGERLAPGQHVGSVCAVHGALFGVGIQTCTVSFEDGTGIRYSVQVTAGTMFEAAALAFDFAILSWALPQF